MRLDEIKIMHGGKTFVLKPEVYDPLYSAKGDDKGRIDVLRSVGVLINDEGSVEDAPVIKAATIENEDSGEVGKIGNNGIETLSRPTLPLLEWALIRTAVAPYQLTALNLPVTELRIDIPEKEHEQVHEYFGQHINSPVSAGVGQSTGTTLSPTSETARRLCAGCLEIMKAYRTTCRKNGTFDSPFLVVAALRMNDGSHTLASVPVLIQPVSAPPLIRIDNTVVYDNCLKFDLSIINAPCRLLIRIDKSSIDKITTNLATHIDFFVSESAPWYTEEHGVKSPLLRTSADILTHSGLSAEYGSMNRPLPLMSSEEISPCLYYPRLDEDSLGEWLCSISTFHKVGEVSLSRLKEGWIEVVDGEVPAPGEVKPFTPDYTLHAEVMGGKLNKLNGLTCIVAPELKLPPVAPLRTLLQYDDRNTSATAILGSGIVEGNKNGTSIQRVCKAESSTQEVLWTVDNDVITNLKWVFYPDSDVQSITLQTPTRKINLHLKRHAILQGAYWCGLGRKTTGEKEIYDGEYEAKIITPEKESYTLSGSMLTSLENCEGLFPFSRILSFSSPTRLTQVAPALRSMSSGELGRFPLYAFTDTAVWAITPTDNRGWKQVQPIAMIGCQQSETIAVTHTSVVFVANDSLWIIEAAKIRRLFSESVLGGEITSVKFDTNYNRLMIFISDNRVVLYCLERNALIGVAAQSMQAQRRFVTMPIKLPISSCIKAVCSQGKGIGYTRLWAGNRTLNPVAEVAGCSLRHFSTAPVSQLRVEVDASET